MKALLATTGLLGAGLLLLSAACGGDDGLVDIKEPGPPVGKPMLPDIAPAPPFDAHISKEEGRWLVRFTTTLVNIGDGDFVLRAKREDSGWVVDQDVRYSESGAKVYRTPGRLVWGGDGHDHWHVARIAIGRLAPYKRGKPPRKVGGLADTKAGFCYYDYVRLLDDSPQEAVYSRFGCGVESDTAIGMGLQWGWADTYPFALPGQSVDVTALPDGRYRLWLAVDEKRWFQEARRDNNVTWADLDLVTKPGGARAVENVDSGPPIRSS